MTITEETVTHVAKLARLQLTEEEKTRYAMDLSKIIQMVDQLNSLDLEQALTNNGPDTTQPTVFRMDEIQKEFDREALMSNAPQEEEGFFRVPKILDDASK